MTVILRSRFTCFPVGYAHPCLLQTFWRPGTGGGTTADASDVQARVRAFLVSQAPNWHSSVTWVANDEVDAIEDTTGALTGSFSATHPASVTGTSPGDLLPPMTAYLIKARTSLIVGRRFLRGRHFLPGFVEAESSAIGQPDPAVGASIATAMDGMLTGGATASFPVVWHRPNKTHPTGGTSGPITGYQAETARWGLQRRRRL